MKKSISFLLVLFFSTVLFEYQADADIKYHPGAFCMSQYPNSDIIALAKGAAVNYSTTTTYYVTCPIVADTAGSMASAKVYYLDNHATLNASCHICTVDADSDVYQCSPTITTSGASGNPVEYSFSNLPSFYTNPGGTRIITCTVLPKYNGYYSGVWSYTIDEN